MKFIRGLILLVALGIHCFVDAQGQSNKQLVSSVYAFANHIKFPPRSSPFKLHVITTDESLKKEFESYSQTQKINERGVQISSSNYVLVPKEVDIIFVSNPYNATISSLLDKISGSPILLVTDRYEKQRDVMINFLDGRYGVGDFEINRANITNQGLSIKPEMNTLGGSEIDIAKIFKQVRDSIRSMEQKANALKEQFDTLNMNVAIAQKISRQQQLLMLQKDQEIATKEQRIVHQGETLDSLSTEFSLSQGRLNDLLGVLESREEELKVLSGNIAEQQQHMDEGSKILEEQEKRISEQNKEIAQREKRLDEMSTVVDSQQSALIFLVLFLLAMVGLSILIFSAYRSRKRVAKTLAEQKEHLGELVHELQDTQSQLVQSEKMASLGVLTAGIAHEINNAINFVYSGIHVLNGKFLEIKPVIAHITSLDEDEKKVKKSVKALIEKKEEVGYDEAQGIIEQMIKSITVGAERTIEIVKGLRTFSRAETEKKTKIDINNDIDVALLLLKSRHKDVVKVKKSLAENVPEVDGYKGQLSQAFLNIISNSIDAVAEKGEDGEVSVETLVNGDHVEVRVKDDGVGIPEPNKQKIFDPFFTTKKIGEGTGLGLSITYGIVERHGGTIDVESVLGQGTEFIIKLPLTS